MKKISRILPLAVAVVAIICYFIDIKICLGIILGSISGLMYFILLRKGMNDLFDNKSGLFSSIVGTILRYLLMVIPLLYSILYLQHVHFIGVIIGFLLFKIVLIIGSL